MDGVYLKVAKLAKNATAEITLDKKTAAHKAAKYKNRQEATLYLKGEGDWNLVVEQVSDGLLLKTVYQRNEVFNFDY